MNNLSSYCGLKDSKMRASDKDLPVQTSVKFVNFQFLFQSYLVNRLHNSSDIIFSSTSSFSPSPCRTTWSGWCKRHFLNNFLIFFLFKFFLALFWILKLFKKLTAEALLRSSWKYELTNISQLLYQNSQILIESR